jgi:hypothetical protein
MPNASWVLFHQERAPVPEYNRDSWGFYFDEDRGETRSIGGAVVARAPFLAPPGLRDGAGADRTCGKARAPFASLLVARRGRSIGQLAGKVTKAAFGHEPFFIDVRVLNM